MMNEFAHISAYSNVGIILVLFILLVIVTSIFCSASEDHNDVSDQSTLDFALSNESTLYRLRWYNKSGPLNIPSSLSLPPGSVGMLYLRLNGLSLQIATVTYRVYYAADTSPTSPLLGEVSFQLEGTPGVGVMRQIRNTSPVSTASQNARRQGIYD